MLVPTGACFMAAPPLLTRARPTCRPGSACLLSEVSHPLPRGPKPRAQPGSHPAPACRGKCHSPPLDLATPAQIFADVCDPGSHKNEHR